MWSQVSAHDALNETWLGKGKEMRRTVAGSETKGDISWLTRDLNEVCPDFVPK